MTTANQYLPIVAWKTIVDDVVMLTSTTYRVTVNPIDINEPGAQLPILTGFYLKDFLGYTYRVSNINVGGVISHIEITDDFLLGWGPQEGRIGIIYESVDLGMSPYLSPGKHKVLDLTALDYTRAFELDILWRNRYQYWTLTPNGLAGLNVNSLNNVQFIDTASVTWSILQSTSTLVTVQATSVLPTASATVLGGIKIGAGLVITSGVASTLFTSLTTTGTGAATLVSGVLNIPTPTAATFVSLTTTGTSGAATLVGGVLNIPNYTGSFPTLTNDIVSNTNYYPLFTTSISGSLTAVRVSSPNFIYNPGNGTLQVTGALSGAELYVSSFVSISSNTGQILLGASSNAGTSGQVLTSGGTAGGVSWATLSSPLITSITTAGTSGAATLISGVLNIPNYTSGSSISLTTTGTGAATLVSGVLNIPTPIAATFVSLKTTGTSGAATLVGGVLNIPNYATGSGIALTNLSVTNTGTSGNASYNNTTGVFNIPNYTITLTTIGTTGAATLTGGVLNVPTPPSALFTSLTTTGTGVATLVSGVLNIPTPSAGTFVSLTTIGTTGAATLVGGVLNIPTLVSMIFPAGIGLVISNGSTSSWGSTLAGTVSGQMLYYNGSNWIGSSTGLLNYTEVSGVGEITIDAGQTIGGQAVQTRIIGGNAGFQGYGMSVWRSAYTRSVSGATFRRADITGIEGSYGCQLLLGRSVFTTDIIIGDGTYGTGVAGDSGSGLTNAYIRFPNYTQGTSVFSSTGLIKSIPHGTAGYVLTSAGSSADPIWTAVSGGGGISLTSLSVTNTAAANATYNNTTGVFNIPNQVYPGVGLPTSTGSGWGTSFAASSANELQSLRVNAAGTAFEWCASLVAGTVSGQVMYWNGTAWIGSSAGLLNYVESSGVGIISLDMAQIIGGSTVQSRFIGGNAGIQACGIALWRTAYWRSTGNVNPYNYPDVTGIEGTYGKQMHLGRSQYCTDIILGDGTGPTLTTAGPGNSTVGLGTAAIRFPAYSPGALIITPVSTAALGLIKSIPYGVAGTVLASNGATSDPSWQSVTALGFTGNHQNYSTGATLIYSTSSTSATPIVPVALPGASIVYTPNGTKALVMFSCALSVSALSQWVQFNICIGGVVKQTSYMVVWSNSVPMSFQTLQSVTQGVSSAITITWASGSTGTAVGYISFSVVDLN